VPRVVLTGASRGIGRATALALARRGADLALPGRPSQGLQATTQAARSLGAAAAQIDCDLVDPAAIDDAARTVLDQGVPDVLINNAAVIHRAQVEHTALSEWQEQLAVNVTAAFLWTRALLPALRSAGRGRVIHVGSIASTVGTARAAAYCASKWALVGFMKALAEELSDSGLITLAVLPGSVDTEMLRGSGLGPRMSAEQVAETLVYYALDAPAAHNGAIIEMFGV
jgi:3-oxoacyl-[acyl-carrier protein] reductase